MTKQGSEQYTVARQYSNYFNYAHTQDSKRAFPHHTGLAFSHTVPAETDRIRVAAGQTRGHSGKPSQETPPSPYGKSAPTGLVWKHWFQQEAPRQLTSQLSRMEKPPRPVNLSLSSLASCQVPMCHDFTTPQLQQRRKKNNRFSSSSSPYFKQIQAE